VGTKWRTAFIQLKVATRMACTPSLVGLPELVGLLVERGIRAEIKISSSYGEFVVAGPVSASATESRTPGMVGENRCKSS